MSARKLAMIIPFVFVLAVCTEQLAAQRMGHGASRGGGGGGHSMGGGGGNRMGAGGGSTQHSFDGAGNNRSINGGSVKSPDRNVRNNPGNDNRDLNNRSNND